MIATRGPLLVDMVARAETIEWQETDSVLEAIILENNSFKPLLKNTISSDPFSAPPFVEYQKITVSNTDNSGKQNGVTVYEYNTTGSVSQSNIVVNGPVLQKVSVSNAGADPCNCCYDPVSHYTIYYEEGNYSATLNKSNMNVGLNGKINKISLLDNNNNLISYTKYNYINSNYIPQGLGRNSFQAGGRTVLNLCAAQGFSSFGSCISTNNCTTNFPHVYDNRYFGTSTAYDSYNYYANYYEYSTFLASTETYKDGITIKQSTLARDPYTSTPTQVLIEDPSQGGILTTTQYAYTQSTYNSMGLKNLTETNENNLLRVSQSTKIKYPIVYNSYGTRSADMTNVGVLIGGSKTSFTNSIPYRTYSPPYFINSNQTKPFWKPYQSYQLVVDANTPGNTSNSSLNWRQVSTATSFNIANQGLQEAQGLNNRYSTAVKMGYNNQYKVASSSDANLNDFAFSSFEDVTLSQDIYTGKSFNIYEGEITSTNYSTFFALLNIYNFYPNSFSKQTPFYNGATLINSHTGNYIVQVSSQYNGGYGPGFITKGFDLGRTYQASVWVHSSSPATCSLNATLDGSIGGTPSYVTKTIAKNDASNITVGNWILMTLQITVPSNYTATNGTQGQNDLRFFLSNASGSSNAYFDDLSIHPVDAPITGYVYNPTTGWLLSTLDNDNFSSTFDYDQAGRVINTYKETKNGVKKISSTSYNFGRQ